jgi:glycosyltransferase involved in cell wall biosynthesis
MPPLEVDHGVEIAHPKFLSLGRATRLPFGAVSAQRRLYWQALRSEVRSFVATGGTIVHVHSCGLPGVVLGRVRPAKLVVSMWDHELFDVVPSSRAWRNAIAHTLRAADAVVYISETLRRVGEALVGAHASHVIPLAIDDYPDITPVPGNSFTVVTAARLIPRKHIDVLIRAFALFREEAPAGRLVILGDGPERPRLEYLAQRLHLAGSIEFTGELSHRGVRERIARAQLFVLPSVRESLGTVYFEAMSVRVPVVGVLGEGIADYVSSGTDGFLVAPGDVAALVDIMRAMYTDAARRRSMGDRGWSLFDRSGMRWNDHVDAHLRLFEMIGGGSA